MTQSATSANRSLRTAGAFALALAVGLGAWKFAKSGSNSEASSGGESSHGSKNETTRPAAGSSTTSKPVVGTTDGGAGSEPSIPGGVRPVNPAGKAPANGEAGAVAKSNGAEVNASGRPVWTLNSNVIPNASSHRPAYLPTVEQMIAAPVEVGKEAELPAEPEPAPTEHDRFLAEVERRASQDPEAAAAWVRSLPAGESRDEAVAFVHLQWSLKDQAKADAWLEQMQTQEPEAGNEGEE